MSGCDHSHSAVPSSVFQSLDELEFERGIWSAALKGDTRRVEKLISERCDVDKLDAAGYTALHYAARSGHLPTVRILVAHGADVNARTRAGAATPLHRAAAAGNGTVVEFLLSKGATVESVDGDGQTALHRAALGGHTEVLENLVTARCVDLLALRDSRGRNVFDCAAGHPSTLDMLKRFSQ